MSIYTPPGSTATIPETPLDWMDTAACKGADPEIFFQLGETEAKQLCRRCPVRDKCLDFAGEDPYGIWGGQSERDRSRVRRKARTSQGNPTATAGDPR